MIDLAEDAPPPFATLPKGPPFERAREIITAGETADLLVVGSPVYRATLGVHNLDRPWRNARTHTLHDPVRWKYAILANYALNGVNPPLHAWS